MLVLCSQHSPTNDGGDGALHCGIRTAAPRAGKEQLKRTSQAMIASDIHNCPTITLPSSGTSRSCVSRLSPTPVTLMNMALLLITFYLAGLLPKELQSFFPTTYNSSMTSLSSPQAKLKTPPAASELVIPDLCTDRWQVSLANRH